MDTLTKLFTKICEKYWEVQILRVRVAEKRKLLDRFGKASPNFGPSAEAIKDSDLLRSVLGKTS